MQFAILLAHTEALKQPLRYMRMHLVVWYVLLKYSKGLPVARKFYPIKQIMVNS